MATTVDTVGTSVAVHQHSPSIHAGFYEDIGRGDAAAGGSREVGLDVVLERTRQYMPGACYHLHTYNASM